ncbi:MAG: AraC family transcriptional regulator [Ruminococcaceae bacterium]|nr:AraC family transcriptional regulator [Oscillospiraceae bacterium]
MIKHQTDNSQKNFHYNAYIYKNTVWNSHFHSCYELIYVMEGEITLLLDGKRETLQKSELILLSPYTVHGFTVDGDSRAWVGVFSDEYIATFATTNQELQFSKFRCDPALEAHLRQQLFFEGQPEHYLCISALYAVCHACVNGAEPLGTRANRKLVNEIVSYIAEHLESDLSMGDLARHLGYEYHYFSSVFHQCFGMDFKKFLNRFRYERACTLLLDRDCDVTEIYRACGFSGLRNFNRVFKEQSGCTPSEYRKRALKKDAFVQENAEKKKT